jgi:hypothetical protein
MKIAFLRADIWTWGRLNKSLSANSESCFHKHDVYPVVSLFSNQRQSHLLSRTRRMRLHKEKSEFSNCICMRVKRGLFIFEVRTFTSTITII